MSYEVVAPTEPRAYTQADTATLYAALEDAAQEYVECQRWPTYAEYLASSYEDYVGATTATSLEEWLVEVSFVTETYLVDDNFKAYQERLFAAARALDLNAECLRPSAEDKLSVQQQNLAAKIWALSFAANADGGHQIRLAPLRIRGVEWALTQLTRLSAAPVDTMEQAIGQAIQITTGKCVPQ